MGYQRLWDNARKQTDVESEVSEALLRGAIGYPTDTLYNNLPEGMKSILAKPITRDEYELARCIANYIVWEYGMKRKEGLDNSEIGKKLTEKYRLTEHQQKLIFPILFLMT